MKTFEQSEKSKKKVSSMIENPKEEAVNKKKTGKGKENKPVKCKCLKNHLYIISIQVE